jgi:hypothetical protein
MLDVPAASGDQCLRSTGAYARLFAECVDKTHFDPMRTKLSVDEQAFEQVVSRFQQYLSHTATTVTPDAATVRDYGVLIHDNNESVAKKHTQLMRHFHKSGTLWTTIDNIIETPLFVDSRLTRMVQMADLCAVALRRYCENKETDLFQRIFQRADRYGGRAVGVRHFAGLSCQCEICEAHRRPTTQVEIGRRLRLDPFGLRRLGGTSFSGVGFVTNAPRNAASNRRAASRSENVSSDCFLPIGLRKPLIPQKTCADSMA